MTGVIKQIVEEVAVLQSVSVEDIFSHSRKNRFVDARAIICYLLYTNLHMSSNEIGKLMKRNHASVLHLVKIARDWVEIPKLNSVAATTIMAIQEHYFHA